MSSAQRAQVQQTFTPPPAHVGSIELILGPMFAGKTTELLRRVKRWIYARQTCCIIKYAHDVRYSENCVSTHDQQMIRATIACSTLEAVGDKWREFDCIAIDEGQFFPDLAKFCGMAADSGKNVVVSALDGDFRRHPFGDVVNLIPQCETITKITAICMMCHSRDACFTRRTVTSDKQELIGGSESYMAVCRGCYAQKDVSMTPRKADYSRACRVIDAMTCKELLHDESEVDAKSMETAIAALASADDAGESPTLEQSATKGAGAKPFEEVVAASPSSGVGIKINNDSP